MKRFCIAYLLFLAFLSNAYASDGKLVFEKANQLYQEGQFEDAQAAYLALIDQGFNSSALQFNLGNTYYKQENIPAAILHYERALKIDPANEDALHNLRLANLKTVDKIEPADQLFLNKWWDRSLNLYAPSGWAAWSIGLLFTGLVCLALFLFLSQRTVKKFGFFAALLFLFLGLGAWFFSAAQHSRLNAQTYGIVYASTLTVRSAPQSTSTELFVIHEGTKVKIVQQNGEWKEVKLMNGKSGWIKGEDIQVI
jgi:tetratricopeptide (TPR) repeat protein